MPHSPPVHLLSKVSYRPIEAAIRWSRLTQREAHILDILDGRQLPEPDEFPQWPKLRLNCERIYDGIVNKDLRVAVNGVATSSGADPNNPHFTVRHLDLKAWMGRFYPQERPPFLFSRLERHTHPFMSVEAVQALFLERDALQLRIEQRGEEIETLRQQLRAAHAKPPVAPEAESALSARSETAYLNIIGALVDLLLGLSPSGQPYSSFRTQEAIITALVATHPGRLGLAERTLEAKFATARRALGK
ncbi:MAG: hypothetical protein KGJ72_06880 [Gammaproteobacteria bacterium]|nr:hypothetical protein [Gammaproteobacteria bacterium]